MVAFLLDENVAFSIADSLNDAGHDAITLARRGQSGLADPDVLLLACRWQRILITHNRRDFSLLHRAWHCWSEAWGVAQEHAGILILDQPRGMTAWAFVQTIMGLIDDDPTIANVLWDWRHDKGWSRVG